MAPSTQRIGATTAITPASLPSVPPAYDVAVLSEAEWQALSRRDPMLYKKAKDARAAYAETIATRVDGIAGRVLITRSGGLSGQPMLVVVPPGFRASAPMRLQTHFHGDGGTIGDANGRLRELLREDPQRVFLLPETKAMNNWSNVTDLARAQAEALAFVKGTRIAPQGFIVSAHSGGGHGIMYAMSAGLAIGAPKLRCDRLELLDCIHYNSTDRTIEQTVVRWAKAFGSQVASVMTVHGTMGTPKDYADIRAAFGAEKTLHIEVTQALAQSLAIPMDLKPGKSDKSDPKNLAPRWTPMNTHAIALGRFLGRSAVVADTIAPASDRTTLPPAPAVAKRATADNKYAEYVRLVRQNGGKRATDRPSVLGIRRLRADGNPAYATEYHDVLVVLSPDGTYKEFTASTYPGQQRPKQQGPRIDATHDMTKGMGMMRPGQYFVDERMIVRPKEGGSEMDVAAWRDRNGDGVFSTDERDASEKAGDLMWDVIFHPGASDTMPRSIGCQNLRPRDWAEFRRRVGTKGFHYTLIEQGGAAATPTKPAATNVNAITPKEKGFADRVTALYAEIGRTTFTVQNMITYFGIDKRGRIASGRAATQRAFERYIVKIDPVTQKPITFLGKPIRGGVNVYALPLLKAAEAAILASGAAWRPAGTEILGYNFRGMKIGGVESSSILSSHSAGLAIDIDAGQNGPKYDGGAKNRGNIPDGVVEALVRAGFVWGGVRKKGFEELGDDPMHFQLSLHPDDARYKEMLASDATAKKYWDALEKQRPAIPPRP